MANASRGYTQALADQYYRKLAGGKKVASGQTGSKGQSGIDYSYLVGTPRAATPKKSPSFMESVGETLSDDSKGVGKVIDVLSQPLYALTDLGADVSGTVRGMKKGTRGTGDLLSELLTENRFGKGNNKHLMSDAARGDEELKAQVNDAAGFEALTDKDKGILAANENDNGWNKAAKFAGSLAIDIAADPLTYIPGGAIVGAAKKATSLGVKGLEATETGTKALTAARLSKPGQDLQLFSDRLAKAKVATQEKAIAKTAAKAEAKAAKVEAKAVQKENVQTLAEVKAKSELADIANATETANKITATSPTMEVPKTPAEILTQQRMLKDTATGESIPFDAAKAAEVTKVPKYDRSVIDRLLDKPAIRPATELAQAKTAAAEILSRHAPLPASTVPVEEMAKSTVRNPKMTMEDWVNQNGSEMLNGVPINEHYLISSSPDSATKYLTAAGIKNVGEQDVAVAMEESAAMLKDAFKRSKTASKSDIDAARTAAVAIPDFSAYVRTAAQVPTSPVGAKAARFVELASQKGTREFTAAEVAEVKRIQQILKAGHSETVKRLQAGARTSPALSVPKPAAEAAEARAVAVEAAQATRAERAATTSARRLTGAPLAAWTAKTIADGVDNADIVRLLAATDPKKYRAIVHGMGRKTVPGPKRYMEYVMDVYKAGPVEVPAGTAPSVVQKVIESPVTQALDSAETVEEIVARSPRLTPLDQDKIAEIAKGANLTETSRFAIEEMSRNQEWVRSGTRSFESKQGALRDSELLGEGTGRFVTYNAPAQMTVIQSVLKHKSGYYAQIRKNLQETATSDPKAAATAWRVTANETILDDMMQELTRIEDFIFANGIPGTGSIAKEGIPLYTSQLFDAMSQAVLGRRMLVGRVIDGFGFDVTHGGRLATTKDFLGASVAGLADTDSLLRIGAELAKYAAGGKTLAQIAEFPTELRKIVSELARGHNLSEAGETFREIGTLVQNGLDSAGRKVFERAPVGPNQAEHVINQIVEVFSDPNVLGKLFEHIRTNSARESVRFGSDVSGAAEDAIAKVLKTLDDQTGVVSNGNRVTSLLHPEGFTKAALKGKRNASQLADAATKIAKEKIQEVIPEIDLVNARHAEKAMEHSGDTITAKFTRDSINAGQAKFVENVGSALDEVPVAEALLLDDITDLAMQTGVFKSLDFLARKFVAHYGNVTIHEAMVTSGSVGGVLSRAYTRELTAADTLARSIAKTRGLGVKGDRTVAQEAWSVIQKGNFDEVAPEMQEMVGALRNLTDYVFATTKQGEAQSILSLFFREGFDIDHINSKLLRPDFNFPDGVQISTTLKGKNGKPRKATIEEMSEQWKSWDIKDPIDFLHKMERVTTELATETSIGREAYRLMSSRGLASTKFRPGTVGIPRGGLGQDSILSKYLPVGDNGMTYVNKELIPELKRMDSLLIRANGGDSEVRNFVRNNLDPILAMWKSGMTIWRPGHHFRNVVGDVGMAFLVSGLKDPKYAARAIKMISSKQNAQGRAFRASYGTWDAMSAMQGLSRAAEGGAFNRQLGDEIISLAADGSPNAVFAKAMIGGQKVDLDGSTIMRGLMDRGALPDFRRQEDLIGVVENSKTINKRISRKTGFEGSASQRGLHQAQNQLGKFTEGRDDFVRSMHALHLIENGIDGKKTWKTVDEMFDQVAARIRKTHPDGSDLTPFESNNMRKIFPFYSWTRKAIPLVFENMLTHPGRFMTYPKAMYNFGEANGVDLESLTQPFPEDQVFPDFISEKMTGIGWESEDGHYWSFDAGVPQADVLNSFVGGGNPSDIVGGVVGMLNPFMKTPVELLSKTSLSTQAPITDTSDYIDSQIPGINSINSIFGVSPTGTVENLAGGTLGVEPSRSVEKGNRGGITESPEYGLNYLFGQKLLDNTKPNYITIGRLNQLTRMNKAREAEAGGN